MSELLDSLRAAEERRFEAEQDAARRIREAESNVTEATQHLAETRRAHEQELRQLKALCEKRIRDQSYQARNDVQTAEETRAQAEGSARVAEELERSTEVHVQCLEKKVNYLQALLKRRTVEAER